jgi:hypothetical protein
MPRAFASSTMRRIGVLTQRCTTSRSALRVIAAAPSA